MRPDKFKPFGAWIYSVGCHDPRHSALGVGVFDGLVDSAVSHDPAILGVTVRIDVRKLRQRVLDAQLFERFEQLLAGVLVEGSTVDVLTLRSTRTCRYSGSSVAGSVETRRATSLSSRIRAVGSI